MLKQVFSKFDKLHIRKFDDKLEDFFYGYGYPVLLAVITFLCFTFKLQYVGTIIFFAIGCYILITRRDATPILPLLLLFIYLIRDLDFLGQTYFLITVLPLVACVIYHFIRFRPKPFNFGRLFLPICSITVALMLSGLFSDYADRYVNGLLYTIPLGPVLLFVYLYFANYICYPENFDFKKYFCVILLIVGILICAEFGVYYLNFKIFKNSVFANSELGWGNINILASMLLLCIPLACYLLVKTNKIIPYLACIALFYLVIFMTGSDGCFGISGLFLPILLFFVYKKLRGNNKILFNKLVFAFVLIGLIGLLGLSVLGKIHMVTDLLSKALHGESGRSKLYRDAWRIFLENPLFGGGFGYYNHNNYFPPNGELRLYNAHSTLFQTIGSMGLVGLVAYVYYYYTRIAVLIKRNTSFNLFGFIAFLMFACYGFIDTIEFSTIPCMITLTLLILATEFTNHKEGQRFYPLWKENALKQYGVKYNND